MKSDRTVPAKTSSDPAKTRAPADPQEETLLREIQDDLRRERAENLWRRYGSYVVAVAVLLVVAVAAFEGWKAYDRSQREDAATRFDSAVRLAETDPMAAEAAFRALAADAPAGYAALARFRQGALAEERGDFTLAIDIYRALEGDAPDPALRELALLRAGFAVLAQTSTDLAETLDLRTRLATLTTDQSPWRFSARELTALLDLSAGERARARQTFQELAADPETPSRLKDRAAKLARQLGDA